MTITDLPLASVLPGASAGTGTAAGEIAREHGQWQSFARVQSPVMCCMIPPPACAAEPMTEMQVGRNAVSSKIAAAAGSVKEVGKVVAGVVKSTVMDIAGSGVKQGT